MLCITTLVDKHYIDYIPLFAYCCYRAYPEYHVKIFVRGDCPPVKHAEIIKNYFPDQPYFGYNTIALRFVIPKEEFKDFTHVYITDIDMMIMRERHNIKYFHEAEMKVTGLCYSNSLRNKDHWKGSESLTGLHYCSTEWFEKTEEIAKKYREYLRITEVRREYDGHMLYLMAQEANLGLPGKYRLVDRHHGIHLGNFRLFKNAIKLKKRMPTWKCMSWSLLYKQLEFREIMGKLVNPVILEQIEQLNKHCEL